MRTYISLFSSAGVGCYGLKEDGFECIATNELLKERMEIQKINGKCRFESGYINADITKDSTKKKIFDEISKWEELYGISDVDIVVATPPCQGMSSVNQNKNDGDIVRNSLIVEAIKMVKDINPNIFVFENVPQFLKSVCIDETGIQKPIPDVIDENLGENYIIEKRKMNFKDYGVPSSRTRAIVIGVNKKLQSNVSPDMLFPDKKGYITLRESIGDLKCLGRGEIDPNDFLHFARPISDERYLWIKDIKEGQSAFDNEDPLKRPGKWVNGEYVPNKNLVKNKYERLVWDNVCKCIHTRSDNMASQGTIHPADPRVLSIRELMRVMSIPESFRWTWDQDEFCSDNARVWIDKNEMNVRRCIGEAVPSAIMKQIGEKYIKYIK